jgi:restriction endonuclease Mrr
LSAFSRNVQLDQPKDKPSARYHHSIAARWQCRDDEEFVRHLSQRVILIDGKKLSDLMIEHNVGVRASRTVEFKRLDEDFFSEEE